MTRTTAELRALAEVLVAYREVTVAAVIATRLGEDRELALFAGVLQLDNLEHLVGRRHAGWLMRRYVDHQVARIANRVMHRSEHESLLLEQVADIPTDVLEAFVDGAAGIELSVKCGKEVFDLPRDLLLTEAHRVLGTRKDRP